MALPRVGDKVTVVVTGEVMAVDEESGGLFDVDYGPGWLTAAEGQLLEESRVVKGLVEFARRGVVWNRKGPAGYGWVCPSCEMTAITGELAAAGGICVECRRALAEKDVTRDLIETALDFLCDHLADAGLGTAEVWRVRKEKTEEILHDTSRYSMVKHKWPRV